MPPKKETVSRTTIEEGQKALARSSVVINIGKEAQAKKKVVRKKRVAKKGKAVGRAVGRAVATEKPLDWYRSTIAPTIQVLQQAPLPPPPPPASVAIAVPSFGQDYANMNDMLRQMELVRNTRIAEQIPTVVPPSVPQRETVGQRISRYATTTAELLGAVGDVAGAVQTGAETVGQVQGAVGAVREVQRQPEAPAQQGSLREAYTMLFGEPAPPASMGAVELSLPASPAPERARAPLQLEEATVMFEEMPTRRQRSSRTTVPVSHNRMDYLINVNADMFESNREMKRVKNLKAPEKYAKLKEMGLL
jgi:hypothetical protein